MTTTLILIALTTVTFLINCKAKVKFQSKTHILISKYLNMLNNIYIAESATQLLRILSVESAEQAFIHECKVVRLSDLMKELYCSSST